MVLKINNISKQFGGITALSNVSFSITEGEILGLIGPNGAGKTTMFNMITSVLAPTSGDISFYDEQISGLKSHQITTKGICRTFQNIRLFPEMTVIENVMTGSHCRTKSGVWKSVFRTKSQKQEEKEIYDKAKQLLETVNLLKERETLGKNLAYGQQRRLEIARALASEPKLLLLDEPAAGMNEQETVELHRLITKIRDMGITILLIEHDMPLVMKTCDRIVVLNFGKKIAEGEPKAIQSNPEVIKAYLGTEGDDDIA
ncbi:branched-chain amino acid transport system ATP-binding protein [Virgibacillus halotolerans]|uniref:ABC transporter ATP-binding protein n=1 Tax=Virgibacillus halotolerans TaxID=1071053 RepID=UPI001961F8D6|nr:ABC transporter ATP-binding protein [Virgibacillus halotolerans]MBM7598961.1 branched-chain amino acid transport system ATP-binding protein [Virgibacillus halotolerans]